MRGAAVIWVAGSMVVACANSSLPVPPQPVAIASPVDGGDLAPSGDSGVVANADPCAGKCRGTVTRALVVALKQQADQARQCYQAALRSDPRVEGQTLLEVRVAPDGTVCSSGAKESSLPDAMNACIVQLFQRGTFPGAVGGCVDAKIPLVFKPLAADGGG